METPNTEPLNHSVNFEEKVKDFSRRALSFAPLFCAIAIAVWWIFFGMVKIYPTSLTITERVGLTFCTVILALTYCGFLSNGGFTSAKDTEGYKRLTTRWGEDIDKSNTKKKEINEYAKDIATQNIFDLRMENLEKNGLLYREFFDEQGNLINLNWKNNRKTRKNPDGYTLKQRIIIYRCVKMRVQIPEIFGHLSSKFFGVKKEETQKQFERKSALSHGIIRLLISLFSVGIMFQFLGFKADAFIYAFFQVVLWTGSGLMQRQKNYNFVINKLKPQILEKCLIIEGFLQLSEDKQKIYEEKVIENEAKKHRLLIEMKGDTL